MAERSVAFRQFCKDAFGEDLSQDGFSDIKQINRILRITPTGKDVHILDIVLQNQKAKALRINAFAFIIILHRTKFCQLKIFLRYPFQLISHFISKPIMFYQRYSIRANKGLTTTTSSYSFCVTVTEGFNALRSSFTIFSESSTETARPILTALIILSRTTGWA